MNPIGHWVQIVESMTWMIIAELNKLCNGYGLDTIETGVTLAVAMEAGVIPFGDGKGAINLVHEMGKGTPMGRILGSGTGTAGKVLGCYPCTRRQRTGYASL